MGLIRSVLLYGSATKTLLNNSDKIHYQALRLCCGAIKTTPVSTLWVGMGEQLLEIRTHQISLTYCAKLKGHTENHKAQKIIKPCLRTREREWTNKKFWLDYRGKINETGISSKNINPAEPFSILLPWIYDNSWFHLLHKGRVRYDHIREKCSEHVEINTDAS